MYIHPGVDIIINFACGIFEKGSVESFPTDVFTPLLPFPLKKNIRYIPLFLSTVLSSEMHRGATASAAVRGEELF